MSEETVKAKRSLMSRWRDDADYYENLYATKLRDCIYGFAIGDALGVPFEFKNRDTFQATDMVGNGTHNQPKGTWSDDTSMMLATCHSFKEYQRVNTKDLLAKFRRWLFDGEYTANGNVFDVGITTQNALHSGVGENDFYSNGNGSLMRIMPLAFLLYQREDIATVSSITHAHAISIEACEILVEIVHSLIYQSDVRKVLSRLEVSEIFSRLKQLEDLPREAIKSSGYVVDTLEASLWCILHTDSYEQAVLKAVNLGGDTDTIGAITGGLAGMIYGYKAIPDGWIDTLRNKSLIEQCLFKEEKQYCN